MRFDFICLILFFSLIYSECDQLTEFECLSSSDCEWVENIESGWCGSYNNNSWDCNNLEECFYTTCQQECNWSGSAECESYSGCSYSYLTYSCSGTTTVPCCSGGAYEIDNSFCQEIEILECYEMNQIQCIQDIGCEWAQNGTVEQNCYSLNNADQCELIDECSWISYQQECTGTGYTDCISQSGCSYSWLTYSCNGSTTVTYCSGGNYESPIFSCDDVSFMPGDSNNDGNLDVTDIVLIVNLILNSEYNIYSDLNQDGIINVIDIVDLVNAIVMN